MGIPNVTLPHSTEKKEKEEPFISMDREMAKRFSSVHPEAEENYFTPADKSTFSPAHDIANTELEKPAKKSDDDNEKDSD